MSEQVAERIRRAVEAVNRDDLEAGLAELHPEVEWRTLDVFPDARTHRGPEAVGEFFGTWKSAFRGFTLHLDECTELDDRRAIAALRVSGEGSESGVAVESPPFWMLFELRDGLLARARMFQTREAALEDAG